MSDCKEQWENHLGTLIQWVHDEKDARVYLENLSTRLAEEVENLRAAKSQQIPLQNVLQAGS